MPPKPTGGSSRIWLLVWTIIAVTLYYLHSLRGFSGPGSSPTPQQPVVSVEAGRGFSAPPDPALAGLESQGAENSDNEDSSDDNEEADGNIADAQAVEAGAESGSSSSAKAKEYFPLNESHADFQVQSGKADYCYIHRKDILPPGWLTWEECCILYHLGRRATGPIYEQGSFRGRSTCCIAQGVKDSGMKKTFITSDIFPIGAKSHATGKFPYTHQPYRWEYRSEEKKKLDFKVDGTRAGSSSLEAYQKDLESIYEQPGGLLAELVGGISRAGLLDYVYIIAGKTVPDLNFNFIWTDSAHGLKEVAANMNNWQKFLREDRPTVFAFHDVALDEESMRYIRAQMNLTYEFSVKTIFVVEAWKNRNWVPIDSNELRKSAGLGRQRRRRKGSKKGDDQTVVAAPQPEKKTAAE